MLINVMGQEMEAWSADVRPYVLLFKEALYQQKWLTMVRKMLFKRTTTAECLWVTKTILESASRNLELCVSVNFVDCLPVAEGGVTFNAKEAPSKGKTNGRCLAHFHKVFAIFRAHLEIPSRDVRCGCRGGGGRVRGEQEVSVTQGCFTT